MSMNWDRRPILPFQQTDTRRSLANQLRSATKIPRVVVRRPGVRPPLVFPPLYLKP